MMRRSRMQNKKATQKPDESLDLDGLDAAAKLVILANWVMDMKVTPDVNRTGIRKVNLMILKSNQDNCAVKLIALR